MNLADCYRVLGLQSGASFDEIKDSYRRLARQYHPDMSPGNRQAQERFIEVTSAYKQLLHQMGDSLSQEATAPEPPSPWSPPQPAVQPRATAPRSVTVQFHPNLSQAERDLKLHAYEQLHMLLKMQRFPRAIALVEGLARRLPQDPEVQQWQAITYQKWGRRLAQEGQFEKARIYLKKALGTDPHNRSLWAEVERDFRSMEQVF